MLYFGKRVRSFYERKIGSVNLKALKILNVKVGGLKKKSAALAIIAKVCPSTFFLDSSPPGFKSFSKFDGQ